VVKDAFSQGIRQLMVLGAGYDTRPYRLPEIAKAKVFEIDLPEVQNMKESRLQKSLGRLPEIVKYIPIDFATQTLDSVMGKTAFDVFEPAVIIWEGVTQYLPQDSIRQTLTWVGNCAAGTVLAFTYVLKSIIEKRSDIPGAAEMLDWVAKNNAPWRFGVDPSSLQVFLQAFHLKMVADVGNAYYQQKFIEPIHRKMIVTEGEKIARAIVSRN
jgi:methyltransferase (TIGR00027 family)